MTAQEEFDRFWERYPRRLAKIKAIAAYVKARKTASAEDILAGLERYRRVMPKEREYIPYPATWLNAGRWLDEAPDIHPEPTWLDWSDECATVHGGTCLGRMTHATRMLLEAKRA